MLPEERQLTRLKWIAILGPLLFLAAVEIVRSYAGQDVLRAWPGYVLFAGVILIGTLFFAETIFGTIGRMQNGLHRQNRELLALHEAGVAITSELELEKVLQLVVDEARDLGDARYGALSLLGGTGNIEAFLTSGITEEERRKLGPIPQGHGLLATVIENGESVRVIDLTREPMSVGFPPHHPPMRSLLAVPVMSRGRILGSFYLTEKHGGPEFTEDDKQRLERFATQAAIAIENANLHRRVQVLAVTEERERIAREMHDTVAQVLGYVNTKAQAAQELLRQDQTERATQHLSQLSAASREAYSDLREAILGLRTSLDADRGLVDALREYLRVWESQSQIAPMLEVNLADADHLDIDPLADLQLLRVIQESLSNVRKHAEASTVRIEIKASDGVLVVVIQDNGKGFQQSELAASDFPRFGLSTMRERAESVNGTFAIESVPGQGTVVTVAVPTATRPLSRIEAK